jgi:hypothetical protein
MIEEGKKNNQPVM